MLSANTKLKDFYQSELTALRQEGMAFAQQHPELAHSLGLNQREARDPQVELLMQSFAFLTGRLQYQSEINQADTANALLNSLYPHLAAPTPSMLIAELSVKPSGSDLSKEQVLVDEVIGGRALCTNRRLAEQITCGATMYLKGGGAVTRITALSKPTPHQNPPIIGSRPWSLVSQLSLNHLSLADGEQALSALKDILRLHVGPNQSAGLIYFLNA